MRSKWGQSPIKMSLLELDPKLSKLATEIFQNIMKWMDDFPLGKVIIVILFWSHCRSSDGSNTIEQ